MKKILTLLLIPAIGTSQPFIKAGPGVSIAKIYNSDPEGFITASVSCGYSTPFYECGNKLYNGVLIEAGYIRFLRNYAPTMLYIQAGKGFLIGTDKFEFCAGYSYIPLEEGKVREPGNVIFSVMAWNNTGPVEIGLGASYSRYWVPTITVRKFFRKKP